MTGANKRKGDAKASQEKPSENALLDHIRGGDTSAKITKKKQSATVKKDGKEISKKKEVDEKEKDSFDITIKILNICLGAMVMVAISFVNAYYMYQIHENHMWFTNIKEVEREISFRTESGLFYSYYKQLVHAPSLEKGLQDLTRDNLTEHPDTINVLARMNIYQETILATVHRIFSIKMEPILFYTYSIFTLHGFLIAGLYCIAWSLTGSWLSGLLAAAFYIFNRLDTTRVPYTAPLRENFALPFLWMQGAAITVALQARIKSIKEDLSLLLVFITTFFFCLFWQFNQFILMLQSFALFAVWVLGIVPAHKATQIVIRQQASLILVCLLQFGNRMLLGSLAVSFNLGFLAMMLLLGTRTRPQSFQHIFNIVVLSVVSLLTMVALSTVIKFLLNVDSDEHIFKFVLNRFGIGDEKDFDSRLYMCIGVFGFIGTEIFVRLTQAFVFPYYAIAHLGLLIYLIYVVFSKWGQKPLVSKEAGNSAAISKSSGDSDNAVTRPALLFHTVQCVFFCALAVMMERMKYLWTPYMCVLASVVVCDRAIWKKLLSLVNINGHWKVSVAQNTAAVLVLGVMTAMLLPPVLKDLEDLSEFWDPDTVELMEWIVARTPKTAAFTGSMQLLAAVKLCTGRPITNHPHYEDKYLRFKTKELYQIYGRREPEDVYAILKHYKSSYIILEDSICRATSNGCRTPDVVDIDNGVMPDVDIGIPGLKKSAIPRFCEEVRHQKPEYLKRFKAVFHNKTFRVYRVM